MKTITINEQTIEALTANGWKRWTKADKDRLYLNSIPTLEVEHYNTGNVRSAEFDGQRISNADARRLMGSKVYIDLTTGELHVDTQYYRNPNYGNGRNLADVVAEHVDGILATIEDEQAAEAVEEGDIEELAADLAAHQYESPWQPIATGEGREDFDFACYIIARETGWDIMFRNPEGFEVMEAQASHMNPFNSLDEAIGYARLFARRVYVRGK